MKVLILALMIVSLSSMAADKKVSATNKSKVQDSSKTLDVEGKGQKEEIVDQTATWTDKNPIKAHITCKAKDGHELKQGDSGYDACIKKVKEDKHNKEDPKADVEVKFEK